jgi:hypothetical protein
MSRSLPGEASEEQLRQLLALEARLQGLVQAAGEDAARRIATERAEGDRRLAAARDNTERAVNEEARAEHDAHVAARAALAAARRTTLAALTDLADDRINDLARRALQRAIGVAGDRS